MTGRNASPGRCSRHTPDFRKTHAMAELSIDVPVIPAQAVLLVIDVQNYNCHPDGGEYRDLAPELRGQRYGYFFKHLRKTVLPNMVRLRDACRTAGIEVMYSVIESLTQDG